MIDMSDGGRVFTDQNGRRFAVSPGIATLPQVIKRPGLLTEIVHYAAFVIDHENSDPGEVWAVCPWATVHLSDFPVVLTGPLKSEGIKFAGLILTRDEAAHSLSATHHSRGMLADLDSDIIDMMIGFAEKAGGSVIPHWAKNTFDQLVWGKGAA